jgi:hypothetical protein
MNAPRQSDRCVVPAKFPNKPAKAVGRREWREGGGARAMPFDSFQTPDTGPGNCVVSGMADGTISAARTRARSRMRESRSSGSARGAARKSRPYRDLN